MAEAGSLSRVTMIEVREVPRLWRAGTPKKRIAAMLGARSEERDYVHVAGEADVLAGNAGELVTDADVTTVPMARHPPSSVPLSVIEKNAADWLPSGHPRQPDAAHAPWEFRGECF